MLRRLAVAVGLALMASSAIASSEVQQVKGTVWENGATRLAFELKLAAEDSQEMPLHGGRVLEVIRSPLIGTFMQILDAGRKPLYSVALGKDGADKTVRFALCDGGGAEISSPAHTAAPACSAR